MENKFIYNGGLYELETVLENFYEEKIFIYTDYSSAAEIENCLSLALIPDDGETPTNGKFLHGKYISLVERFCRKGYAF